ncbi:MAG: ATP-dependent DNA helicase [Patescibacteria group bacterium]
MINEKENILSKLNQEQLQSVTHKNGPLLIVAGAGTGKTSVITKRIAWLIEQKLALPNEILALTFTDKAAGEMENRALELLPYGSLDIWISTFHSFGDRIIKDNAMSLGFSSDYQVFSKPEEILFFKDNIFKLGLDKFLPLGNPTKHIESILDLFSRLKDEDISPKKFKEFAQSKDDEKLLELSNIYEKFTKLMRQESKIDFGDQIYLSLELLRSNKDILHTYRKQFKYILLDEFQDTNHSQYQLIKLLLNNQKNITVVADDDQSIYRFRGAAISNVLDFNKDFPEAKLITLTQNYRSTKQILSSAYKLIQHNNPYRLEYEQKINKKLEATKLGKKPTIIKCENGSIEADTVAEIIKNSIKNIGYEYKDFAILVRANSQAEIFLQTLDFELIPYHFSGKSGLYNLPEIRLIINFLKALTNDDDNLSIYHLATSEIFEIKTNEIIPIMSYSKKSNIPLKNILQDIMQKKKFAKIDSILYAKIENLLNYIKKYQDMIPDYSIGQLVYSFLNESGYLKKLMKFQSPESEAKISNISHFFESIIKRFETSSPEDRSAIKFINNLELLIESGENPATSQASPDDNVVKILTIHSAKGLEFKVVFMVSLTSDRFPSKNRSEALPVPEELIHETLPTGDYHMQEERRLFYVGITRAKEELYFSMSKKYHDNIREKKPSQFIIEAMDEIDSTALTHSKNSEEVLKRYIKKEAEAKTIIKYSPDKAMILNPHQIDDYLTCPLKFKYVHILQIPVSTSHQISFGNAIHKTIEFFLKQKIKKNIPTIEEIYTSFENNWINEGYITREHEQKRFNEGKQAITNFYNSEKNNPNIPTAVEKSFSFKYNDQLTIKGRFDLIYQQNNEVEIKDFKTSNVDTEEDALKNAQKNRPFAIYSLAIKKILNVTPKLTMHFINKSLEVSIFKKEKDEIKLTEEISKVITGLNNQNFVADPTYQACNYCPYKNICPDAKK